MLHMLNLLHSIQTVAVKSLDTPDTSIFISKDYG